MTLQRDSILKKLDELCAHTDLCLKDASEITIIDYEDDGDDGFNPDIMKRYEKMGMLKTRHCLEMIRVGKMKCEYHLNEYCDCIDNMAVTMWAATFLDNIGRLNELIRTTDGETRVELLSLKEIILLLETVEYVSANIDESGELQERLFEEAFNASCIS